MSEKISKQLKYYHANKDKINEKNRNSKQICECGSSIPKGQSKRHYDTKKHQNFLANYGNQTKSEYSSIIEDEAETRDLFYYDVPTSENNTVNNKES